MPNHEKVRLIFKDTYNFYTKWKDISNPEEWDRLMQEVRDLNDKYNYNLCRQILLELVAVIQSDYIARRDSSG